MQIKPHQIPHFARQRERFAEIRSTLDAEPKEEGSYFSRRFEKVITIKANKIFLQVRNLGASRNHKVL